MAIERNVILTLASAIEARANCIKSGNAEWKLHWEETIVDIERNYLPSGSGFDSGCKVDLDRSNATRVVIDTSYHHHGEHGYDGWTDHSIIATPTFHGGVDLRISGRDRNDFKDYAGDVFAAALTATYKGE